MFFQSRPKREASRLARERKTLTKMLHIFCRAHHGTRGELCEACAELHAYAMCRLDRCPFGAEKPTCAACPIHCYKTDRRQQIRDVMRYAGPRMLWRHPLSAIRHLLVGRRAAPAPRNRGASTATALDVSASAGASPPQARPAETEARQAR